jgi:hypothetical protein
LISKFFFLLPVAICEGEGSVLAQAEEWDERKTHRHRNLVLLKVVDELDHAGKRLNLREELSELEIHRRKDFVDGEGDAGRFDQLSGGVVSGSTHQRRLDLPREGLAVRGEDGIGGLGKEESVRGAQASTEKALSKKREGERVKRAEKLRRARAVFQGRRAQCGTSKGKGRKAVDWVEGAKMVESKAYNGIKSFTSDGRGSE